VWLPQDAVNEAFSKLSGSGVHGSWAEDPADPEPRAFHVERDPRSDPYVDAASFGRGVRFAVRSRFLGVLLGDRRARL